MTIKAKLRIRFVFKDLAAAAISDSLKSSQFASEGQFSLKGTSDDKKELLYKIDVINK
jgi:hypothetical protein